MATFVRTQQIAHRIGERGRLMLKVTSSDVRLTAVDGGDASLRATFEIRAANDEEADHAFEELKLHVDATGDQLLVEEQDGLPGIGSAISHLFGGRGHVNLSVEGQLPRSAELQLEGVSSDIQVEGLRGDQHYTTVSGDLYLTDIGGSVQFQTVSGDVTARAAAPVAVTVEAVSGDLSLIAPRLDGLRANTVSGDLEIEGALGSGEFRVDTVSGDLTVGLVGGASFEVRGLSSDISSDLDHRIEGRGDRRRMVVGAGGPSFVFGTMSGDLVVRRPRRVNAAAVEAIAAGEAGSAAKPSADEQLAVLRALEAGEIDVDEATRRLAGDDDA